jgi:ribosomal protein S18 acetylase RimI-like enzyme
VATVFRFARDEMTYLPVLHTPAEDLAFFSDRVVESPLRSVTVAEIETSSSSAVVGFSAVHDGWLEHLYVHSQWQNSGIGSALLRRAMADNPPGLLLWVFEENDRAAALYKRAGFVVEERTDGRGNEEGQPDLRMRWTFTESIGEEDLSGG